MRIAETAEVIQASAKSIRKWIERDGKDGTRWLAFARTGSQGQAAEFTDLDLLRLRLLVVLLDYGMTFQESFWLVNLTWSPLPADPPRGEDESRTVAAILADFQPEIVKDELGREHELEPRLIFTVTRGEKHIVNMQRIDDPKTPFPIAALIVKPYELFSETLARARAVRERKAA